MKSIVRQGQKLSLIRIKSSRAKARAYLPPGLFVALPALRTAKPTCFVCTLILAYHGYIKIYNLDQNTKVTYYVFWCVQCKVCYTKCPKLIYVVNTSFYVIGDLILRCRCYHYKIQEFLQSAYNSHHFLYSRAQSSTISISTLPDATSIEISKHDILEEGKQA